MPLPPSRSAVHHSHSETEVNKTRLILVSDHNSQQKDKRNSVIHSKPEVRTRKSAYFLLVIFICMGISFPGQAHAGLFDVIASMVQTKKVAADQNQIAKSSQTVELLLPNQVGEATGTDNFVDSSEDGALSVTAGPLRLSTEDEIYIPDEDTISVYTVHKGDTLESIAKLFNVSTNTIIWGNNLTSKKIKEGDVLTILPVSGIRHTIKKGDTIKSIAKKYNADASDISLFNGITGETALTVGDVLLVPDGEIAVEKPKAKVTTAKGGKKVTTKAGDLTRYDGYYIRPISGGRRTVGIHGHNAVDLATKAGSPIYAAASGKVIIARTGGYNGGYGNYIVISHPNGTQTLYAHNSQNLVSAGESVVQGQVIGAVGSTGKSTGPHVHFEIRGARNPF